MRRNQLLLTLALFLLPLAVAAQDHPHFFITAGRESTWAQMKSDYEANVSAPATYGGRIYKSVKLVADAANNTADVGQYGAWMYHVTGDSTYVTNALVRLRTGAGLLGTGDASLSGNYSRENFWQDVWIYDWLYPGLAQPDRDAMLAKLNTMATNVITKSGSNRSTDTDQCTGDYMGLAMLYLSTHSYNSTIDTLWNNSLNTPTGYTFLIGGLDSTGNDTASRRNVIRKYVETFATDGEWMESTEYNIGTMKLITMGAEAIKTWTSVDHFPEVTTWMPGAALQMTHMVTPDMAQAFNWGDVQSPRALRLFYRLETAMVLAGLTQSDGTVGPQIQDWCLDMLDQYSTQPLSLTDGSGSTLYPRYLPVFNPYATRGDHTTESTYRYASGQHVVTFRRGWSAANDGLMINFTGASQTTPTTGNGAIDHYPSQWGSIQWYRNGTWLYTHPIGYGGIATDPRGTGEMIQGGIPANGTIVMRQYQKTQANEYNATADYVYVTGTQGGMTHPSGPGAYGGADPAIMEDTRSIVYLPDFGAGALVIHNRANAKDPTTTTHYTSGYAASQRAWIESQAHRKFEYFHTPVDPTATSGSTYTAWPVADGTNMRVDHLLPTSFVRTIENQTTAWVTGYYGGPGTFTAGEKKYDAEISPPTDQQWDTFLSVMQNYSATPFTSTLVRDTTNKVDGAFLTSGSSNVLLAFNALQGADLPGCTYTGGYCYWTAGVDTILDAVRIRTTGYTLTYTAGVGTTTKALLFDLDTGSTWHYTVNGGAEQTVSVTSQGVGVITSIATTGSVTLAVYKTTPPPFVTVSTASVPNGTELVAYSQALSATGGTGPYTWAVTAGALESHLSLSAGGTISGTPAAASAGAYSFTVTATDSLSVASAPKVLVLTIAPAAPGTPGTITGSASATPESATLTFGGSSLAADASCPGVIVEHGVDGSVATFTDTTFSARRTQALSGLDPSTTYDVAITCDGVQPLAFSFTTSAAGTCLAGTINLNVKLAFKPPPGLLATDAYKVFMEYGYSTVTDHNRTFDCLQSTECTRNVLTTTNVLDGVLLVRHTFKDASGVAITQASPTRRIVVQSDCPPNP